MHDLCDDDVSSWGFNKECAGKLFGFIQQLASKEQHDTHELCTDDILPTQPPVVLLSLSTRIR